MFGKFDWLFLFLCFVLANFISSYVCLVSLIGYFYLCFVLTNLISSYVCLVLSDKILFWND
jgi:hypothetical protein